jgi:translocation and assembly module TamB
MNFLIEKAFTLYNLQYDRLEGNLLKNLTIYNIKYKNGLLAKKAHIDINFRSLLRAKIKIDDITIQDVDIEIVDKIIKDQFAVKDNNQNIKSIPSINITSIFFSTKPYHKNNINIDQLYFVANEIKGDIDNLSVDSFSFYSENDHTNLTANGTIHDKTIDLHHLWITDIDLVKIENIYEKFFKKNNNTTISTTPHKKSGFKQLVNNIKISNFKTNLKPYKYKKYSINQLIIQSDKINSDFKSLSSKVTTILCDTNMWKLSSKGKIENNSLDTNISITLNDKYFKRFVPFFDFNKIKPLKLSLKVDKDGLYSDIELKTSNILTKDIKNIDLGVKKAVAYAKMRFKPIDLVVNIDGNLTSRYDKNMHLLTNLYYDKKKKFHYDGILDIDNLQGINKVLIKLLNHTKVNFVGDSKKINGHFENNNLTADYNSKAYKLATLNTHSNKLKLDHFVEQLPEDLKGINTSFDLQTDINFKDIKRLDTKIDLKSNAINFKGKLLTKDRLYLNGKLTHSKKSIIKNIDKNLKLNSIFPLNLKTDFTSNKIKTVLTNKYIQTNLNYQIRENYLDIKLNIFNDKLAIAGNVNDKLFVKAQTISLKTLQENFKRFYNFKHIPLDGETTLNAIVYPNNNLDINLKSRWLIYEYQKNKFAFAEKIKLNLKKIDNSILLNDYYFSTYLDYDRIFYAKKPSKFIFKNDKLNIEDLWINDQAKLYGNYNFKNKDGNLTIKSDNYHYKGKEADISFSTDVDIKLSKNSIDIEGDIQTKKGTITYSTKKEHFIQDDDIIILQEQIAQQKRDDNLSINISLLSTKPLRYKVKDTDIKLDLDLKFWKDRGKNLELLGVSKILSGEHFENKKKFTINSSEVLFAGEIFNPYLNVNVTHQNEPYEITININGLLDSPILNFSSIPFLTQSDILSILLFNSTTKDLLSSNNDSSKAAISMFGNTFAREIVENFGIKLDKLVLSTTEDGKFGLEVGKKISKKMTIIYINDIVQTIKIKYQHSKRFESDITLSPNTSGIDFLYKNEY